MADDSYETVTLKASAATSVAFSPDEARIYIARPDGGIDVFDTATRAIITTWSIGTQLGGLSVSEDGSFLLVTELNPSPMMSVLYRVDTATGSFTSYTAPGQPFHDVEIVDADTAIATGGQDEVTRLDLGTGLFSPVENGVYYSNGSVMVEDQHLTLLAEPGISNGPLALYDDRTDTIVARGDNYQSGASSGFNFGQTAVSEAAGLVAQFSYYQGINIYDLNLLFQEVWLISGPVDGVAFDPTGAFLFVRTTGGPLEQYDVATHALVDSFPLDATSWSGGSFTGDQITFSEDGKIILVHDSSTGKLQLIDLHARDQYFGGSAGADAHAGGRGDDTYVVNHPGDTIAELPFQGIDTVLTGMSYTLTAEVERLELTGSAVNGTGNTLANRITGNALANRLDGGAGADTLIGLGGDDWYFVDSAGDAVIEGASEGANDRIFASFSFAMGAGVHVERLTTTNSAGIAAIDLAGNELGNLIYGNAGNNVLNGGAGADILVGFGGDDTYIVDNLLDRITEGVGEGGNDRVLASASYELRAGVHAELLATTADAGTTAIDLTGNALDNMIRGNAGSNVLDGRGGADRLTGLGGDDWYYVDNADDVVVEGVGGGNDRVLASVSYTLGAGVQAERLTTSNNAGTGAINLTGNELSNTIYGNAGANVLDGQGGADTLVGLGGDDRYYVDNAADVISEAASGGAADRVFASVNYTLRAGVHAEWLATTNDAGTGAINLTGNELASTIHGNAGTNVLDGRAGNDTLVGFGGNDTLIGGAGIDSMTGGTGDDLYYIDSALDGVFEVAGGGTDRVYASVSYALGAAAQVEWLTTGNAAGADAINLTGNAVANTIHGNAGANTLDGRGGADVLVGLGGDDRYYVDSSGDVVNEGAGEGTADRILASVSYTQGAGVHAELLTTNSNAATAAIDLTGNELANTIYGNAGANVLDGKGGADILTGFGGQDVFAFTTALGAGNIDAIDGFSVPDDTISLENAVFTGLAAGALAAGAFNTGAAAADADDRVIYDSATGALLFDADGLGGAAGVQFASVSAALAMTSADFFVI